MRRTLGWMSLPMAALLGCGEHRSAGLELSGTVEAPEIRMAACTNGPIVRFFVNEGDRVARGQRLVCQDSVPLALQ